MDAGSSDTKLCNNCKRDISTANFVMHEMHCRRHIQLCEHCQEPVPRSEMEQHFNDVHATTPCPQCRKNVAKSEMDTHMASECERRQMPCEFCELAFPKNEFETHVDFCGSRTECCPLCQQYIMLKDMLRHENSGCTFPTPKPVPVPQPDDFSVLEMNQFLGGDSFDTDFPDFSSSLRCELDRLNRSDRGRARESRPARSTLNQTTRRDNSRRKNDVNVQRANNLSSSALRRPTEDLTLPPDLDYDEMLALQMAHDDWGADTNIDSGGFNPASSVFNSEPLDEPNWEHFNNEDPHDTSVENSYPNDDGRPAIPCEFCDENIPLESYITHLGQCPLSNFRGENQHTEDLNNQVQGLAPHTGSQASIPVINNLRRSSLPRHEEVLPDCDNIMLPCEFCEEMFPSEIIIQHQSVCQANGMATPRVTTPAAGRRNNTQPAVPSSLTFSIPSRQGVGRQSDSSLLDFAGHLDNSSDRYFNTDNTASQSVPQSSSNKYNRPVDRFDADVARPPRRSSRPSLSTDEASKHTAIPGNSRPVKRENLSAQRARARLNQLLQDDGDQGSHDVTTAVSTSTRGARTAAGERKTSVDSLSVMRQLDASRSRPNKNRPSKNVNSPSQRSQLVNNTTNNNNSSSNNNGSSAGAGSGGRSRQRADGLFSPELRLKPDHNPGRVKKK